jgi:hypothetical protein
VIARSYIYNNLKGINYLYIRSTSAKKGLFYSKLAILELCGWTEESMDDIIYRCAKRYLRENDNLKVVEKDIIKKTFGFEYDRHFRQMMIKIIGLINLEKIEQKFDHLKIQLLKSTLDSLKYSRDIEAHTHIKGVTRRLDSPSVTINNFLIIYDGLKNIDDTIRQSKFIIEY